MGPLLPRRDIHGMLERIREHQNAADADSGIGDRHGPFHCGRKLTADNGDFVRINNDVQTVRVGLNYHF